MYTSRFIDAVAAQRIGLISEVVPDDKLDQATESLIAELLKVSRFAKRMNKEIYNASLDSPSLEDTTKLKNRTQMLCGLTNDMIEAVSATFFEKRPPVYKDD